MSTHKWIDRICVGAVIFGLLVTLFFVNGNTLGITLTENVMGYENRLFDSTRVHSIDLVVNDWDGFLEECENEEYVNCAAVIDGESYKNVALRAKGNTSLSSVKQMDSSRYSLKLEFDHYQDGGSYHGLDKLCLNNLIQDNTMMKDFLVYQTMAEFGVDAPLCSYVYVTVNGEDWGLFLAVEGLEDAFMERVYNSEGELYKPDSMSFGGGRGNGKDFNFDDLDFGDSGEETETEGQDDESRKESSDGRRSRMPGGSDKSFGGFDGDFSKMPGDFDFSSMPGDFSGMPSDFSGMPGGFGGGFGGMGSDDVKLKYIDDDADSYSNIFNNAKTDVTTGDQNRLIAALKKLGTYEDLETILDMDEVLRYFVVHNFVVNGDSYTGSMIHNYYLHEEDGQLSMIPWDYNLAFGTFQGNDARSAVNDPIDSPLSVSGNGDKPMADWIFSSEEYTELYHKYLAEFLESNRMEELIGETAAIIDAYVEKDPTKFCTYEEFQTGVSAMKEFVALRTQSVQGQLDGTIPSTDEGQSADSSALIQTGDLNLSDMGSMGGGKGGFGGGNRSGSSEGFGSHGSRQGFERQESSGEESVQSMQPSGDFSGMPQGFGNMPEGFSGMPGGAGNTPEGFSGMPGGAGNMPEGFSGMPGGAGNMPGDFSGMPGGFGQTTLRAGIGLTEGIWLGASAAILLLGILFVKMYRRRRL